MDAARFASGLTWDAFVASAQKYQDLWSIGVRRVTLSEVTARLVAAVRIAPRIAVLNEDWCLDAVSSVPAIVRLAQEIPGAEVRIFGRDANPDLMDAHLTNGSRSIPVAIVHDADFRELGCWGPRPAPLQAWFLAVGKSLPSAEKYQYIRQWYARDRAQTTLAEVAALLHRVGGAASG